MNIVNIHNLPSDIPGDTWKEKNMDMKHLYKIGTLVEIIKTGARLFVIKHTRDCDGTPLYMLVHDIEDYNNWKNNPLYNKTVGGYSEKSLKLIRKPNE